MPTNIDIMDPDNIEMLSHMQGNILKGHGRDHTTHIFLHFNPDETLKAKAKDWLKKFATTNVTSCNQQLAERERFKRNQTPGGLFVSVFLTAAGYKYLGFTNVGTSLPDEGFKNGMRERADELADIPNDWEAPYNSEKIHAMLLLADDNTTRMAKAAKEIIEAVTIANNLPLVTPTGEDIKPPFNPVMQTEYGHAIRNANGDGLEHNGYVDGVSQPLFLKDEVDAYMKFHNIPAGTPLSTPATPTKLKFDPTADTSLVLVADPFVTDTTNAFGSYFVFRKLEQNVKGFKDAEETIGRELYPKHVDEKKRELAGAYIVGRFEDGSPVVLNDEDGLIGSGNFNNFNYDKDPSGGKCPYFAHVRKVNPRETENQKERIMARRGIPFGQRDVSTETDPTGIQLPEGRVGLLFMSYQASLVRQFEFQQQAWANNPRFNSTAPTNKKPVGIDPVIGQKPSGAPTVSDYFFPKDWDSANSVTLPFEKFVHMKGGEYFFAPSIPFFETL